MDTQSVKIDLIRWLTEVQDTSILEKLQILKESYTETHQLSADQEKELDARLEKYEAGELTFSSWDTIKSRIRDRSKNAL
ncbi:MAG: addiction module protein [Cyclobacteriaceae bacterium]|nr:addiction module protein [Cyclobacteriaceae bacterium]